MQDVSIEMVADKFVKGVKEYLLTTPGDSNVMYVGNSGKAYEEVDADIRGEGIICTYIEKDKASMRTQVYRFRLSKELVVKSIQNGFADKADIFLMGADDMSEYFVLDEMYRLLTSRSIEDEYIYGTGLYMCALYVKDESNMLAKAV